MKRSSRNWMLAAAVALAHLAAAWLVADSTRTPRATLERATEVGLVGPGLGVTTEAPPLFAPVRPQPATEPPTPAPAPAIDPPLKAVAPDPVEPPKQAAAQNSAPDPLAPPDPTQRPIELDPAAAAALALAARSATLPGGTTDRLEAQCGVVESLQRALQEDATVQTALALVPKDARSVANAISVWNTTWAVPGEAREAAALQAVKARIIDRLGAASPTCRLQTLRGPRLITLQSARGPTSLAVGSGEWRWADLME